MLIIALAIVSAFVAGNLIIGNGPVWPAITLYWVILAIKNFKDLL
jgi:hypothetical protein